MIQILLRISITGKNEEPFHYTVWVGVWKWQLFTWSDQHPVVKHSEFL